MIDRDLTSREKKAIQTKNRIYECALKLIRKEGFDNVAVGDICKAAEVSVGLFYYYFPSKNDIIFEVYKRADNYFQNEIKASIKTDDFPEKVAEYMRRYIGFVDKDGIDLIRNLYIPTNTLFTEKGRAMQLVLEMIIKEGQEAEQIDSSKSPKDWVLFIFTVLRGIVFDWCLYKGEYNIDSKAEPFIEMVVQHISLKKD